jgi:hypothetical protein
VALPRTSQAGHGRDPATPRYIVVERARGLPRQPRTSTGASLEHIQELGLVSCACARGAGAAAARAPSTDWMRRGGARGTKALAPERDARAPARAPGASRCWSRAPRDLIDTRGGWELRADHPASSRGARARAR